MKHFIYSISILLFSSFMTSCYEDKGNYDYKALSSVEVKVAGIEPSYQVKTMDVLEITPSILPDNSDYECYWEVYPSSGKKIVISREKNLKYPVTLQPGNYKLRYFAKNKQTEVFSYTQYELTVETDIVKGWWLLKEKKGNTDIDIHTAEHSFTDRIFSTSGESLEGAPQNFLFSSIWLRLDSIGEGANKRYTTVRTPSVFVASEKDLKVLDFYSTQTIGTFESLFKLNNSIKKKPEDLFFSSRYISLLNDGKIYFIRTSGNSATSFFSDAILGNYKLSDHKAVAYYWKPLMYDEVNSSFCTYSIIDNSMRYYKDPAPYKVRNLNADLLFFDHRKMVNLPEWAYALLKSKTKEEHYLYKFSSLPGRKRPLVLNVDTLKDDKKMFHADRFAYTKGYNQTFFAIGNTIWSCEFAGFTEKQQLVIPAGETITYMETLVSDKSVQGKQPPVYFVLATTIGEKYKFYVYNIQAGNIEKKIAVYEGEGAVNRGMLLELEEGSIWQTFLD